MKKFITTPIYYINAKPHLGNAYTTIAADVLARYYRQKGDRVFFLTGTDEHGAKIAEAARKAGKELKVFADEQSKLFENLSKVLNFSNDAFIRTTDPRHENIVRDFLQKLYEEGYIYEKEYSGLYCVGCEKFLTEKDLEDGKCPDHKTAPLKQSEKNWFFKLSQFQNQLKKIIESDELKIRPETRKNEILGKINLGLEDVSVSRANLKWGIKVPWDEEQTIYVWVDALINYWSAPTIYQNQGVGLESNSANRQPPAANLSVWPPDLHIVGRDILWFHAVIWPALLLAAGKSLPKEIFVQGYFTVDGQKMSKTVGNVIDPVALVQRFGADSVRYYVLRDFPYGEDGDVSVERLKERHNNDLAAGLGNLVQRVLSMIKRYSIKLMPTGLQLRGSDSRSRQALAISSCLPVFNSEASFDSELGTVELQTRGAGRYQRSAESIKIQKLTEELKFQEALAEIWKLIARVNKEIADVAPWQLAKKGKRDELSKFLNECYLKVLEITDLIEPYLPETAKSIKLQAKTLELKPIFEKVL